MIDRQPVQGIGIAGFARLEYGADVHDLTCDVCGATWCGHPGEDCGWCTRSLERLADDERRALLAPAWLPTASSPAYDELEQLDRTIWRQTRGWSEQGSIVTWIARLRRATDIGLIDEIEAVGALRRAAR